MNNIGIETLSSEEKELLDAAENVMENAYNPYSHFFVGAALRTKNGDIITGANVENAAYGSTICAERAAVMHANAKGQRHFVGLALIVRGETFDVEDPSAPCGSCLQVLNEFAQLAGENLPILLSNTKKTKIIKMTIQELNPNGFGPKDLQIDLKKYLKS